MKNSYIIAINIANEEEANFILRLRHILTGEESSSYPHITLRGPLHIKPNKSFLNRLKSELMGITEPVLVSGVGIFENPDYSIVFFKVRSSFIYKKIFLSSYPNSKNPHITLYKSKNRQLAKSIYSFLSEKYIEFQLSDLEIDLLDISIPQRELKYFYNIDLIFSKKIFSDILAEAKLFMNLHQTNT